MSIMMNNDVNKMELQYNGKAVRWFSQEEFDERTRSGTEEQTSYGECTVIQQF